MKVLLSLILLSFSDNALSQDLLKVKFIDSLIGDNEKQTARIIADKHLPDKRIYLSHGEPDTVLQLYKYSWDGKLIEYSKTWINSNDTGQVTSFFFRNDSLLKVITSTPYSSFFQFAYFDNERVVSAGDNEGHENPNIRYHLRQYKKILKNGRLKKRF